MIDTDVAVEMVLAGRRRLPAHESLLVAVSGIDGAGKGYVASLIGARLRQGGLNAVTINIDGWLNLPPRRVNAKRPAEHFYHHAIRFEEVFRRLILPLIWRAVYWAPTSPPPLPDHSRTMGSRHAPA